jgi:hypothetical protein
MKKQIILLVLGFLIAGFFTACEKENLTLPDEELTLRNTDNCCVDAFPSAPEILYENTTFDVSVSAYNDGDKTYVTISRGGGKVMTVRYAVPGLETTQTTGTTLFDAQESGSFSFDNPEDWECGDAVTFSFYVSGLGGGSTNTFQSGIITYYLKDVCACDTELTGEGACDDDNEEYNRTAVYTFTYDGALDYVKIQGGLTNFTGGDAAIEVEGPGDYTVTQETQGGSSNRRITVEGPASCDPITITIRWNSTNSTGEITGDWTAKDADGNTLGSVNDLTCSE